MTETTIDETTEQAAPELEDQVGPEAAPNREAAKYRTRLREVETERDTANARIETLARQLVEMNLPQHLKPEVFWRVSDATIVDYLTDDGINTELIAEHARQIEKDLGILDRRARGPVVPSQRGGEWSHNPSKPNVFEAAFAPRDED